MENNKEYISQEQLINKIKIKTDFYKSGIKAVLDALEEVVREELLEVGPDSRDKIIRLFTGLRITANYIPPHEKKNSLINGKVTNSNIDGYVKIDSYITPAFKEHIKEESRA